MKNLFRMKLLNYLLPLQCATQRCKIVLPKLVTKKIQLTFLALLPIVLGSSKSYAQQEVLTLNNVLDIVRKYHPVARQANLIVDSAKASQLAARGAFDPSFYIDNQQKTFDGKNYYYYTNPELKIPTWYGLDFKAGVEDNGGERITREVTTGRTSYVGVSLPLLKNLLTDRRRTTVQQARLIVQQSEATRRNEINNILYDATSAYWNWVREYQVYNVIRSVIDINERRLSLVRRSFLGGDRAAIDTVEALTQLQNFQFMESEAQYRWISAGLEFVTFCGLTMSSLFS